MFSECVALVADCVDARADRVRGNEHAGTRVARRMRFLCSLAALSACTASVDSVVPPTDQLFFPTGIAVSPDEATLFVTNANSELRYNTGTISVFDLALIDATIDAWEGEQVIPSGCARDGDHRETLVCDEAAFMRADAGVRMGDFATNIAMQDLGDGRARLLIPTRGDPSVTWVEWNGTGLICDETAEPNATCDDAHRLVAFHDDVEVGLISDQPFDAYVDSAGQFGVVTDLASATVMLLDLPAAGVPLLADVITGVFSTNSSGYAGASAVAGRTIGADSIAYVGSPFENRIQMFTVGRPANGAPPWLLPGEYFFLDGVGVETGLSADTRGLAFGDGGDRLYALNRNPPTVQILDTSVDNTGAPRSTLVAATDVCRAGEKIVLLDGGDGDRAYVTCFDNGQLYVVDPRGAASVEDIVTVGRGAYGIAASPTRRRIYVTNVLEDTVAVVDASAESTMRHRVVLRLGKAKVP